MSSSANTGIDENAFYGRLLVLSGLHSLDRNRIHRIERWKDRTESFCKASTDSIGAVSQDSEDDHKFRVFLDCLAELCASARNGRTVTAVTVHLPETSRPPQYLFVSNSRSNNETNAAKRHVEGILEAFEPGHNYPDLPRHREVVPGVRHEVLQTALEFDQQRFKEYVKIIYSCRHKLSNRDNLNKSSSSTNLAYPTPARHLLERLKVVLPWDDLEKLHRSCWDKYETRFVKLTLRLMEKLEAQRNLKADGIFASLDILLANRTQVDKSHYLALWHEFQHGLKRILSLQDSLAVIAAAAREWPELFKGVTVRFLHSSWGKAYKLQRVDHLEPFLRRLGLDDHTTEKAMSRHGLSREINKDIQGDPYKQNKRSIHAEIQLWAHIRRTSDFVPFHPGRPHTSKGAANTSVIGVSKLTCRLCHWFFQNVYSHRVVIRPSSWNVYHRWALPSLPKDPDITRRLHNELDHEISRVLAGGEVQRTETDTDSAPNSAGIFFVSGESSCDSSDFDNSGIWSHVGLGTSSTESDSDRWKADSE